MKEIKNTMNGFIDFFGGITNNNFETFKFSDKNELEELRNKNAELRDELDKIGAELNKQKEKNKILEEENEGLRITNNTLNEIYDSMENRHKFLQQQLSDIENRLKEFGIE